MTGAHIIFIPAVLSIGILIGFILANRMAADRANVEKKREEERAAAKARRAERRKARKEGAGADDDAAVSAE